MKALKILCACLLALPLLACAHISPTALSSATGDVGARIDGVISDLKAARPHADAYGQGAIDSGIAGATQIQTKDLPPLQKGAADYATEHAENVKLKSQWISPRMWGAIWVIGGSLVGVWILAGVLTEFAGGSVFVAAIAGLLKALGSIGGSVIGAVSGWLTSKIVQGSAAISKMHTAAQTLHAVAQDTKLAQNSIVTGGPVVGVAVSVPSAGPGTKRQPIQTS